MLYFNDTASLFIYNSTRLDTGELTRTSVKLDPVKGAMVKGTDYDSLGQIVYCDFVRKTMILRQTERRPLEAFTVEDIWYDIPWTILEDRDTILGFDCLKAQGFFRGRAYTAWFARQIPVPAGPWKLKGLPGLIVKAEDTEGMFRFEATQVEYPLDSAMSLVPPKEAIHKSMFEYLYYLDNLFELIYYKMQSELKSRTNKVWMSDPVRDTSVDEERMKRLETYYEWEPKAIEREKQGKKTLKEPEPL